MPKRTIGSMQGSLVDLNKGIKDPVHTFVAEGIETALSIKDALSNPQKQSMQVLTSLGKSNLSKLSKVGTSKNITLVLDNDKKGWRKDKSISYALESLENQGKTVNCIRPKSPSGEKTDYNDLAQAGMGSEISRNIDDNLPGLDDYNVHRVEKNLEIALQCAIFQQKH